MGPFYLQKQAKITNYFDLITNDNLIKTPAQSFAAAFTPPTNRIALTGYEN